MWCAYVDESEPNSARDPYTYLLAAALIDDEDADGVRHVMLKLRPAGHQKLHWHKESHRSRMEIVGAVARLSALHLVVVVRYGQAGETSERRRRKCLARLAYELDGRGIERIIAEGRERKANDREVVYFDQLRSTHVISAGTRLDHLDGPGEPLLWVPDIVAGAVATARTGEPRYLELLAGLVDLVVIDAADG